MTIILILAVALVSGVLLRSRWALLIPLGIGVGDFAASFSIGPDLMIDLEPYTVAVVEIAGRR